MRNRLYWILGLAVGLLVVGATWRSIAMTRAEREQVRANVARVRTLDRAAMNAMWHVKVIKPFQFTDKFADRIAWVPSTTATLALAITPRHAASEFDAIFTLFDGPRAAAVFALAPQGMFFNDQEADLRHYPELKFPRTFTPAELERLDQIVALLKQARGPLDPQSPRARWLEQVVGIAGELRAAHAKALGLAATSQAPRGEE